MAGPAEINSKADDIWAEVVGSVDASAAYVRQEAQSLGVSQVKDLLELLGNTDLQAIIALTDGSSTG